ncbi:DUF4440 domain-containing protein [Robiginitalea sp. SC105]|uniref:YybH family protein n=1 Tax=Robiginitalea sp. SC105 TaxID=2762332 RepID=UPI00163AC55D|nr:nuclear transport factor 2 family protein [Robiginitalea sp. SC105]MBC2838326.1 nuclear transport factor 2 family protein [Robiginitalea sp. SC105]
MPATCLAQDPPSYTWIKTLEQVPERFEDMYTTGAVTVLQGGEVLQGSKAIGAWWKERELALDSMFSIGTEQAHVPGYEYEVSQLVSRDGTTRKLMVIWNLEGEHPRRELEVVAEVRPLKHFREQLEARRAAWMDHCNAHRVEQLVNDLYAPNALYYNHRPLVRGREEIINTYRYMKNTGYRLKLEPLLVEPVNEHLVFEIGQCSGSYPGKYILVWTREEDGKWYILLDSNI